MESYLINKAKVPGLTQFPDGTTRRLKAMALEYQKSGVNGSLSESLAGCVVDAAYNYHSHTNSSCFGKSEHSDRKRKRDNFYECRYRFPRRKKRKTVVQNVSETAVR
jgi:hypothetical protein